MSGSLYSFCLVNLWTPCGFVLGNVLESGSYFPVDWLTNAVLSHLIRMRLWTKNWVRRWRFSRAWNVNCMRHKASVTLPSRNVPATLNTSTPSKNPTSSWRKGWRRLYLKQSYTREGKESKGVFILLTRITLLLSLCSVGEIVLIGSVPSLCVLDPQFTLELQCSIV